MLCSLSFRSLDASRLDTSASARSELTLLSDTALAARQATDMAFFAPFTTAYFYAYTGLVEQRPWHSTAQTQGIKDRLMERWAGTVVKQWIVFGPATAINLS